MPQPGSRSFKGKQILYHYTDEEHAASIYAEWRLRPSTHGTFGAAIYFAESRDHASDMAMKVPEIVIKARVDLGRALYLEKPARSLTKMRLRDRGCDSVWGRVRGNGSGCRPVLTEYAVFDPKRVVILTIRDRHGEKYVPRSTQPASGAASCAGSVSGDLSLGDLW
jgi:hypothetical protein